MLPNLRDAAFVVLAPWLVVSFAILALAGCFDDEPAPVVGTSVSEPAPIIRATAPVREVGDFADRVFYSSGGSREWGTVCKLGTGWVSVHHVTVNGTPVVGPTDQVTAFNEASDWSFLGVDPAALDADDFGSLTIGESVTIMGYPARDRDGEIIPAKVYLDDPHPPFMWLELQPLDGGAPPEGVVGGVSGSCVLGDDGRVEGVVHANGFSPIAGTTNTWALVVPIRAAILEAQGKLDLSAMASALLRLDPEAVPKLERGRFGLLGAN